MDEDVLNLEIRKFLKRVGISSQREIERAVREALASGRIGGSEKLSASMLLRVPELDLELRIEDTLALG